ncbi:hypothetical protein [Nodosilinea sp. LEGE 07088]|uniref:hypothetical protein n=1 Tax=Nodosilinea sp. LEGE 07088 TaxID=2777968 RepID=UPI001D154833|nr:hypothetical protein [Nodosilinea sp. LEGE 07088]
MPESLPPTTLAMGDVAETRKVFYISSLIRLTLLLLYLALMGPLPFLAQATQAAIPPVGLIVAIGLGWAGLYGALSQRVEVDSGGIEVAYPAWVRWLWRGGWRLPWTQVRSLKPRSTGQGGIVYYLVGGDQQAYLLPMRVAGFARLVEIVETYTGIDTQDIKPLAQPWMYIILLGFTLLLLLVDAWTITTALQMT